MSRVINCKKCRTCYQKFHLCVGYRINGEPFEEPHKVESVKAKRRVSTGPRADTDKMTEARVGRWEAFRAANKMRDDAIVESYVGGNSIKETARDVGCSDGTVQKILGQRGIKLRSKSEGMKLAMAREDSVVNLRRKQNVSRDNNIEYLYTVKGKGSVTISRLLGINPETVLKVLRARGVEIKPKGGYKKTRA